MKVLFVCNQNQCRSPTAEELFKGRFQTKSAGLYNERPVAENQLSWADTIVVMEEKQRIELVKRFPKLILQKRVISFDIPDTFCYNQPELVQMMKDKEDLIA
jgi:predicted protein tyrosine phosphatase